LLLQAERKVWPKSRRTFAIFRCDYTRNKVKGPRIVVHKKKKKRNNNNNNNNNSSSSNNNQQPTERKGWKKR